MSAPSPEPIPFPTLETALQSIESYARRSGIKPADLADVFAMGCAAAKQTNPALLGSDADLVVTWGMPPEPAAVAGQGA